MMHRRAFLKKLLILGSVLTVGTTGYWTIPEDQKESPFAEMTTQFFKSDDLYVLLAILPVMLAGNPMSDATFRRVIDNMDQSILLLSEKSQLELRQLFDLLGQKLARVIATGIWQNWKAASANEIAQFLENWRDSFLDLLQTGYQGLHQLVMGNYYADSNHWQWLDYPGPPKLTTTTQNPA